MGTVRVWRSVLTWIVIAKQSLDGDSFGNGAGGGPRKFISHGARNLGTHLHNTEPHQYTNSNLSTKVDLEMMDYKYRYDSGYQVGQCIKA